MGAGAARLRGNEGAKQNMPVFDKRRRELERRKRKWAAAVLTLGSIAFAVGAALFFQTSHVAVYMPPTQAVAVSSMNFTARRPVFPHSIVAGGVYESKELAAAVQLDPVAREHYHDIQVENMVPVRIPEPLQGYVSYRTGDKIYWTRKKLTIPRGELVLTDGRTMIRARCGNRISARLSKSQASAIESGDEGTETTLEVPASPLAAPPPERRTPSVAVKVKRAQENDVPSTPEPASLFLYGSGAILILANSVWQRRRARVR